MKIPDFEKVHVQVLGAEESFGASGRAEDSLPRSAIQHVKVYIDLSTGLREISQCPELVLSQLRICLGGLSAKIIYQW